MSTQSQTATSMNCPNCSQQLTISPDLHGKNVQCPNCQKEMSIPAIPPVQNQSTLSYNEPETSPRSGNIISLEGVSTPDLPLNSDEVILLDIPQGFWDLGLAGLILRHKGRLIVTNQRSICFRRKTKDFSIEQINMRHTGAISMVRQRNYTQLGLGAFFLLLPIILFANGVPSMGPLATLVSMLAGILLIFLSSMKSLVLSGSGEKIVFNIRQVPSNVLSKVLTAVNANS
jgi:hypothetical protein